MNINQCPRRLGLSMASLAAAATLFFALSAQAATCTDKVSATSPLLSNGFAFNPANTRNQATEINASNVATLKLAYAHVADGSKEKKGAPAVTEQAVFFSEGRDIVAANRSTGCQYWRFSGLNRTTALVAKNAIRSSSIFYLPATSSKGPMVYAGDFYGNFYALDALSGKQLWRVFLGTDANRHFITGAPQFYNNTLFVPVATKEVITTILDLFGTCCSTHGMLQAIDPYSGKIKWTYHTSADAKTIAGTGFKGPNGMSLWGTPAIDVDNNAIVIGTGQNLSQPTTNNSDSVISLNMGTGKVNWIFQATQNDAWNMACVAPKGAEGHCPKAAGGDFDFGAPPIVVTLSTGQKAIIAGAKNAAVYSLDPKTGALNWSKRLGVGGSLGGVHWGMAVDPTRVYAAVADVNLVKNANLSISELLTSPSDNIVSMAPAEGGKPGLYALDLLTGNVVWEKHDTHAYQGASYDSIYSAALSVTNDVLLASSLDGVVKAFRAADGQELWAFNTAVATVDVNDAKAGSGGTIDSVGAVPAGRDLLINSGYSSFGGANAWKAGPGNSLFVLRLP